MWFHETNMIPVSSDHTAFEQNTFWNLCVVHLISLNNTYLVRNQIKGAARKVERKSWWLENQMPRSCYFNMLSLLVLSHTIWFVKLCHFVFTFMQDTHGFFNLDVSSCNEPSKVMVIITVVKMIIIKTPNKHVTLFMKSSDLTFLKNWPWYTCAEGIKQYLYFCVNI